MNTNNPSKTIKLPSLSAIIAFVLFSNSLFWIFFAILINNVFYYGNMFYSTKAYLTGLPQIQTEEELASAVAKEQPQTYFISNVPISGKFVKDPLLHLNDNTYIYIDYDEEVANSFFGLRQWSLNQWNIPTEARANIKVFNTVRLDLSHDNHLPIAPTKISENN